MTTDWKYRINVIVPIENTAQINALWTVVAPKGDAEAVTFGVPLSSSGQAPSTHRGCSTAATDDMRLLISEIFVDELIGSFVSIESYNENNWLEFLAVHELVPVTEEA